MSLSLDEALKRTTLANVRTLVAEGLLTTEELLNYLNPATHAAGLAEMAVPARE